MTNIASKLVAVAATLLLSSTMLIGAVGPATALGNQAAVTRTVA